jgi:hypothetical protein
MYVLDILVFGRKLVWDSSRNWFFILSSNSMALCASLNGKFTIRESKASSDVEATSEVYKASTPPSTKSFIHSIE